jgi:hypothetical protein
MTGAGLVIDGGITAQEALGGERRLGAETSH